MVKKKSIGDGADREKMIAQAQALAEQINNSGAKAKFLNVPAGRWADDTIIRTGSLGLDLAIGIGGLPRGKMVEIYGESSSGKTTTAIHVAAEAQRAGLQVVVADAEASMEPKYCNNIGVDTDTMIVVNPDSLEQWLGMIEQLMEQGFDGIFILDSIPALLPNSMMELEVGEEGRRAAMASLYSKTLPRIKKLLADSNATYLNINQTRSTMATKPWEAAEDTPGGKALKFNFDLRIHVTRKVDKNREGNDGMNSQTCKVEVIKNKVSIPHRRANYTIFKDGTGINWGYDVMEAALQYEGDKTEGIIQGYKYEVDRDGVGELVGKNNWFLVRFTREELDFLLEVEPEFEYMEADVADENGELQKRYFIQAYQMGKFSDMFQDSPAMIEMMEERLLNSLNDPMPVEPSEEDETPGDEDSDDDDSDDE